MFCVEGGAMACSRASGETDAVSQAESTDKEKRGTRVGKLFVIEVLSTPHVNPQSRFNSSNRTYSM